MNLLEAANERHSVRSYVNRPIEPALRAELKSAANACNIESGLHIQLVFDEPYAFDSFMAHYGKFHGVKNYIALIGPKGKEEAIGYYGEKIALTAQALGLNTCWVALTYKKIKSAYTLEKGEKLYCVLALGYGETQGVSHKSKDPNLVFTYEGGESAPEWLLNGTRAALLAPTAMNQQKFHFFYDGVRLTATAGRGFYTKIDLGIAKFHFELGAEKDKSCWN